MMGGRKDDLHEFIIETTKERECYIAVVNIKLLRLSKPTDLGIHTERKTFSLCVWLSFFFCLDATLLI